MSKKSDKPKTKKQPEQPAWLAELLTEGTTTLEAKTPDELNEMIENIPAECSYGAGAVGRSHESGLYTLRIDLTK